MKPCKGINKAKGHGCGGDNLIVRYGLCTICYPWWLLNTPEGKVVLKKSQIKGKKEVAKKRKAKTQKMREGIETKRDLEKKLQPIINAIVREIDKDKGCVSCRNGWDAPFTSQKHAGHRLSVGSNPHLRFNLYNIYQQCQKCNSFKGGEPRDYDQGLEDHYGTDALNKAKRLTLLWKDVRWTKEDLRTVIPIARQILKEMKEGAVYSREEVNLRLAVYVK